MDYLLTLAQRPPVIVAPDASVHEAVETMSKNRVGAIGVVEGDRLVGIFTERDVMERVVLHLRDPGKTRVAEVMTSPVKSIRADRDPKLALEQMVKRHIRHLPITDDANRILGMLSIRNLLQDQLENAKHDAESLEAYLSADGPGG
jgi:CBS domain-containing protein